MCWPLRKKIGAFDIILQKIGAYYTDVLQCTDSTVTDYMHKKTTCKSNDGSESPLIEYFILPTYINKFKTTIKDSSSIDLSGIDPNNPYSWIYHQYDVNTSYGCNLQDRYDELRGRRGDISAGLTHSICDKNKLGVFISLCEISSLRSIT